MILLLMCTICEMRDKQAICIEETCRVTHSVSVQNFAFIYVLFLNIIVIAYTYYIAIEIPEMFEYELE